MAGNRQSYCKGRDIRGYKRRNRAANIQNCFGKQRVNIEADYINPRVPNKSEVAQASFLLLPKSSYGGEV